MIIKVQIYKVGKSGILDVIMYDENAVSKRHQVLHRERFFLEEISSVVSKISGFLSDEYLQQVLDNTEIKKAE